MASEWYPTGLELVFDEFIAGMTSPQLALLQSSYTFSAAHNMMDDLTGDECDCASYVRKTPAFYFSMARKVRQERC